MDFSPFRTNEYPLEFLVAVGSPELQAVLEGMLPAIAHGWTYSIVRGTALACKVEPSASCRFLVAEYGAKQLDLPAVTKRLQLPMLLLVNEAAGIPESLYENPVVLGTHPFPLRSSSLLKMAILQAYWASLARHALQFAGMLVGGIEQGK